MRTKEYRVKWTHYSERGKYSEYAMVYAENRADAEKRFFRTHIPIDPVKSRMVGYIINSVQEV